MKRFIACVMCQPVWNQIESLFSMGENYIFGVTTNVEQQPQQQHQQNGFW